jgi:hypothetical protein
MRGEPHDHPSSTSPVPVPPLSRFARPRSRLGTAGRADRMSYGPEDRVKDGSLDAAIFSSAVPSCPRFALASVREPTPFPSSASSGHPLSPAVCRQGRRPVAHATTGQDLRSDATPRRASPSRRPGCLPPSLRPEAFARISPVNPPCRPLAHAAHTFSTGWGKCFGWALQALRQFSGLTTRSRGLTTGVEAFERASTFSTSRVRLVTHAWE